jgi:hypothetical protein
VYPLCIELERKMVEKCIHFIMNKNYWLLIEIGSNLIERILMRRGNRVLVKWLGYPDCYDQWINENEVINLARFLCHASQ